MSIPICKVWDAEQGKYIGIPALKGTDGKTAYQYAVEGGYTGTETEFAAKLAAEMPDKLPNPKAITFTGAETGSYDGSAPLSVNIPTAPTKTSQLTNDSGYLTLATLPKYGGEVV